MRKTKVQVFFRTCLHLVDKHACEKGKKLCFYFFLVGFLLKLFIFAIFLQDEVEFPQEIFDSSILLVAYDPDSIQGDAYAPPVPVITMLELITTNFTLCNPQTPQYRAMN